MRDPSMQYLLCPGLAWVAPQTGQQTCTVQNLWQSLQARHCAQQIAVTAAHNTPYSPTLRGAIFLRIRKHEPECCKVLPPGMAGANFFHLVSIAHPLML